MYYNRVSKIELQSSKKNKEGHTEYLINAFYQDLLNPIQFKSRYSTLLELHKALIPLNKKDSLPQFPGKNLFGTKSQDLILKRLSDINEYFDNLLRLPQLGGYSIIIYFINNKSVVKKELCWRLQVRNRIELFKYYFKEKKPISNTLNQKVYKLIKNNQPFVLKKYGLDDEINKKDPSSLQSWRVTVDQFSNRVSKIKSDKYLSMIEQLFINSDPYRKCNCKSKEFYTKLWIVSPYYESTLESEIDLRYKNKKSFSSNEIMDIFRNIMKGLEELYINQLYHRNLKPSNVGILKQNQKFVYQLMDYHDLLLRKKEKSMAQGNANSNRYSINLAYKSPKRISQIRLTDNSKNSDEDYKNFDMYALGIILLQLCLVLPTSELQGFQEISQLRDDMINNQLQQIKQKYDESLYQYICVLLNKSTLSVFSNQDKYQLQKLSIFDIVYSKLFNNHQSDINQNATQNSPQVSPPKNNENNISSTKALSEQSTTCGSSSQDIENQQKQADQEIQQEKQGILEYADECFILKFQQNTENLIQQKKTQHILRILLSECNLNNEQIKEQLQCIKEPSNFKGYASICLAKNQITNSLGIILKDFLLSLENIDSISIDLKESQNISAHLILNILESIEERKQITVLLIDISKCPQITSECINSIIIKASQISHLLLFSLYFFKQLNNILKKVIFIFIQIQFKSQRRNSVITRNAILIIQILTINQIHVHILSSKSYNIINQKFQQIYQYKIQFQIHNLPKKVKKIFYFKNLLYLVLYENYLHLCNIIIKFYKKIALFILFFNLYLLKKFPILNQIFYLINQIISLLIKQVSQRK
ncbi:kinase domain protein (macronuclear) [Tetrahymena thermophila SB210]|uniref:non-specific serine/threonine protein kinase n=1 Tax=Tetrahymena thermophila (strain SB210) TaxID=312017 RepID=Q23I80_TETTS|nr:kinase domain protein [Tetrahymena thermophila SB210]EAR96237.2 kinase domain protein [Tetrahymena thermophila SB210]|eukprot:XP_001016482.2 kinase domain protein [Tetrahymena thermophila SB210]